ncbi:MAG TPA: rhodanese-like domain-containing protein [Bacteroidota bacterium]|nr:rhodanese-like domain-containing protein [Bacteroidota bacterium]
MTATQVILYAFLLLIVLVYARRFFLTRSVKRYSTIQLADRMKQSGFVLLDVRTAREVNTGSIKGAINIPVQELARRMNELKKYADREIICYCQTGSRSLFAAALLKKDGYTASHLEGGIAEWNFTQR